MTDIRVIIDQVSSKGFTLYLSEGAVKVQGPAAPDDDTAKLLDFLREHREEVRAVLSAPAVGAEVVKQFTVDGDLRAVELCSRVLEDHLYILFDLAFELPNKILAVYFPDELEFLKTKDIEQLKAIHKTKLVFPGCRVNQ
jgi:hypothetical protein